MRSLLYFSWLAFVASPAFAADPVRVGYALQTIIFGGPVQCGIEQGFFARLGLGIVPTTYSGGAKLHQAMAAGAVDLALASITDMALLVKGAPERVIYGVVNAPYSVSIMALNPAIRSADDLKGRKIGVTTAGSYTYWLVSQLPRFLHWDSGRAMPVSVGGVLSGQMAALVSGQIDALVGEVGVGLTLEQEKRGRIVLNAADVVHDVPASVVFGETTFLRDHPDVVARFIQGLRQSLDHIISHRDDTIDLAMRNSGFGREAMSREVDIMNPGWSRDGRITEAELTATAQVIVQAGLLEEVPNLTPLLERTYMPK